MGLRYIYRQEKVHAMEGWVNEFDVVDSILVRLRPKRSLMLVEPDLLK